MITVNRILYRAPKEQTVVLNWTKDKLLHKNKKDFYDRLSHKLCPQNFTETTMVKYTWPRYCCKPIDMQLTDHKFNSKETKV